MFILYFLDGSYKNKNGWLNLARSLGWYIFVIYIIVFKYLIITPSKLDI